MQIEKVDSSNGKWTIGPFSKFCNKIQVGFCLNTGKQVFLEVSL